MRNSLSILIAEDSEDDAELVARQIKRAGYDLIYHRVDTAAGVASALRQGTWDVVIADYSMPSFSGVDALRILKNSGLDLPFILISGTVGEDIAVEAMKAGADDYLMKSNLIRLVPAIEREIREAAIRAAKRRIEHERLGLIEQLQEALRARDEFLIIASHELKTPLTSIKLQTQLIKRMDVQNLSPELKEQRRQQLINSLDQKVERLSKLIDNLLDVSRISMGRLTIKLSDCDLAEVVREIVESFREDLKQARSDVEIHADVPVVGEWDRMRMEQVAANLIGNAIKYAKGSLITVTVEPMDDHARLVVQDRGPGVAKEDQDRLFQRFERAALDHAGGLGLGLYITRQIVESHGGIIRLESELGKGAKFIVELPLRQADVKERTA